MNCSLSQTLPKAEKNAQNFNDVHRLLQEKENLIGKLREELALAKRMVSIGVCIFLILNFLLYV